MTQLRAFFSSVAEYMAAPGPERLEALRAAHPGWEPDPRRLAIYGNHARGNLRDVLDKLFAGCKRAVPAARWQELMSGYYATRPAREQFEINRAGAAFPEWLRGRDDIPAWLPDLAQFEWYLFEVYSDPTDVPRAPERLQVNPTLVTLEMPWRLCRYYAADPRPDAPDAEEQVALLWRHPRTLYATYQAAAPRALLALKVVVEEIPLDRAAAEGDVPLEEMRQVLAEGLERGFLLGPLPGGSPPAQV